MIESVVLPNSIHDLPDLIRSDVPCQLRRLTGSGKKQLRRQDDEMLDGEMPNSSLTSGLRLSHFRSANCKEAPLQVKICVAFHHIEPGEFRDIHYSF